jgi:hypothetical protein
MSTDDIHELGLSITCGRHGLETEECILLCNINGVGWSGYSLLSLVCFRIYLFCGLVSLRQLIQSKDSASIL